MEGNHEVLHGWPFGLGNINSRITAEAAVAPPPPYPSHNFLSSSFSSFSSSNLDTESTGSFFPDQSVSLGRLIGVKPVNKGRLLRRHHNHHREFPDERSHSGAGAVVPKGQENAQGICSPLLHHVIGMMGRNGSRK